MSGGLFWLPGEPKQAAKMFNLTQSAERWVGSRQQVCTFPSFPASFLFHMCFPSISVWEKSTWDTKSVLWRAAVMLLINIQKAVLETAGHCCNFHVSVWPGDNMLSWSFPAMNLLFSATPERERLSFLPLQLLSCLCPSPIRPGLSREGLGSVNSSNRISSPSQCTEKLSFLKQKTQYFVFLTVSKPVKQWCFSHIDFKQWIQIRVLKLNPDFSAF